jgi:hypothetical protein
MLQYYSTLLFAGDTAQCCLRINAPADAGIALNVFLKRTDVSGGLFTVKSWLNQQSRGSLSFTGTYVPAEAGTYHLIATVTISGTDGADSIYIDRTGVRT